MIARGSEFNLSLPDDIRTFVESETARAGYADAGAYVCALIQEAKKRQSANGSSTPVDPMVPDAWEVALQVGASVPEAEWAKVPGDLASNVDHYLYGAPREK